MFAQQMRLMPHAALLSHHAHPRDPTTLTYYKYCCTAQENLLAMLLKMKYQRHPISDCTNPIQFFVPSTHNCCCVQTRNADPPAVFVIIGCFCSHRWRWIISCDTHVSFVNVCMQCCSTPSLLALRFDIPYALGRWLLLTQMVLKAGKISTVLALDSFFA